MSDSDPLSIESIHVKDLYAFACDFIASAEGQEISPITKQRALSQSKNPYADDDDVALLVASIGGKCVGHLGLLPGRLATPAGTSKVFWCTAMYVHPDYRHRMVAVHLVRKVLSLRQDCLGSQFSEASFKLLAAMGFRKLPSCAYLTVRFERLDWFGLPFRAVMKLGRRYRFCRKTGELGLRISETLWLRQLKRWIYVRLERRGRKALQDIALKEVQCVRPRQGGPSRRGARFVRDVDAVNWTLDFPWVREGGDPTGPPYYFSDVYPLFRNCALEVCGPEGEYRGFVILTIQKRYDRTVLKLRDFDLGEGGYEELLFRVVIKYAARYDVDSFELPVLLESWVMKVIPFASLVVHRSERQYLYHPKSQDSPLAQARDNIALDLNDGETSFF